MGRKGGGTHGKEKKPNAKDKLLAPSNRKMLNPGNWGGAGYPASNAPPRPLTRRLSSSSMNSTTSAGSIKQPQQLRNTLSNSYQQQQPGQQRAGQQPGQQRPIQINQQARTVNLAQNQGPAGQQPKPSNAPAAKGGASAIVAHKPSTVVPAAPSASKNPPPATEAQDAALDEQVKALGTEKAALQEELSAERLKGFEREEEVATPYTFDRQPLGFKAR